MRRNVGSVQICDVDAKILIADQKDMPSENGEENFGWYNRHKGELYLLRDHGEHPTRTLNTALHEIKHGILEESGTSWWIQSESGMSEEKYEKFEEELIRRTTPYEIRALMSIGVLKHLPKRWFR